MRKQYIVLVILLALCGVAGYFLYARSDSIKTLLSRPSGNFSDVTLRIGAISDSPKKTEQDYSLLAGYLKSKLGFKQVDVVIARTALEMAVLLQKGKEDVFIENPFASYALRSTSGSDILLSTVEPDGERYRSVFIVPKNSKIKSLADLKGKRIAFKVADSASSYFLPKADLLRRGVKLTEKEGPSSKVESNEVGYYFSNDNEATLDHLIKGKADIGAMSESNYSEKLDDFGELTRVLDYTEEIALHVASFRKDLDPTVKNAVVETLMEAHSFPPGKSALEALDIVQFKKLSEQPELVSNMEKLSSYIKDETLTH